MLSEFDDPPALTRLLEGLRSQGQLVQIGLQLLEQARRANLLRESGLGQNLAKLALALPLPQQIRCLGEYYLLAYPQTKTDSPDALIRIADEAAPGLRERVLLQVGNWYRVDGEARTASSAYFEAARASRKTDLLTHLQAQNMLAVCQADGGNHFDALSHLQELWGPMQVVAARYPAEFLDYLNSLAVELNAVGHLAEATRLIEIALKSPIAPRYPHWAETKLEIAQAARRGVRPPPLVFALGAAIAGAAHSKAAASAELQAKPERQPLERRSVAIARPRPRFSFVSFASLRILRIPLPPRRRLNKNAYPTCFWLLCLMASRPARAPPVMFC